MLKWAKARLGKNRRSRRAISTIMANLTMLVIVVVLSSLLFVWAVSSFGAYQGGAGYWFSSKSLANQERISIENVYFFANGGFNNGVKIYIRNVGAIPFTIASVYVNGTLYNPPQTLVNVTSNPLTVTISPLAGGATWAHGDVQTIKVATLRGTVETSQWVA